MKKVYLIATFVAIIAGIATYFFASQLAQNRTIKDAPTKSVVIAVVTIPENTTITADMVAIRQYTTVSVVGDAAGTLADVVGKLNKYPIVPGEQIIKSKLTAIGQDQANSALSYQLKKGEYAYTIAVDNVQGVAGFISKGDYVDILYTSTVNSVVTTNIIMSNIYVLRIADFAANTAAVASKVPITNYVLLTFKLNQAQIIELTNAVSEGTIKLALKPITSGKEAA